MKTWKDHLITGFAAGFISPVIALLVFLRLNNPDETVQDSLKAFYLKNVLTHVISLSVLINLVVFFSFLWAHNERSARGVLGATIFYAIVIMVIKFF